MPGMTDAMLRERAKTNHDAAPEARARTDADRGRTDKADARPGEGTGDTPTTHATRGEGSEQRECTEPVAWAVTMGDGSVYEAFAAHQRDEAVELARQCLFGADGPLPLAPLYRQPPCQDFSQKNLTLTDAEREAIVYAARRLDDDPMFPRDRQAAGDLRSLLERLGGGR